MKTKMVMHCVVVAIEVLLVELVSSIRSSQ